MGCTGKPNKKAPGLPAETRRLYLSACLCLVLAHPHQRLLPHLRLERRGPLQPAAHALQLHANPAQRGSPRRAIRLCDIGQANALNRSLSVFPLFAHHCLHQAIRIGQHVYHFPSTGTAENGSAQTSLAAAITPARYGKPLPEHSQYSTFVLFCQATIAHLFGTSHLEQGLAIACIDWRHCRNTHLPFVKFVEFVAKSLHGTMPCAMPSTAYLDNARCACSNPRFANPL